jgi:hypothetical protein
MKAAKLLRYFKDKNGKVVVWQTPNIPIIGWFVFLLAAKLTNGHMQITLSFMSTVFLVAWAYLEITKGASYFRRTLGFVILAFTICSRLI